MPDDEAATPLLRATAQRERATLLLSYAVTNTADRTIYIFNKLISEDDSTDALIDTNRCTIELREDNIYVGKQISPIPVGMRVEAPILPCVSELAAGETLEEHLVLPLPLRPWNPYLGRQLASSVRSLPLHFELGYFYAAPGTRATAHVLYTPAGALLRFEPFTFDAQLIAVAGPIGSFDVLI